MSVTQFTLKQLKQTGATDGQVITWDNALQIWTPTTITGGGAASGISGSIQFSDGASGFLADDSNLFWNDTTNQLQLAGGTSYALAITGQNGGINVAPASSITGALNAYRVSADATGLVNLSVFNTNTSSGGARFTLSAATGGGDPYINISTGEITYTLGVDNSDANNLLYLGQGTDPSNITTANFVIKGTNNGMFVTNPTARLHLPAGTTTANTAPLKLTSGTAMTTAEDGALEYHGSHLYFTIGTTRYQLDQQSSTIADGDYGDVSISGGVWTVDAVKFNRLAAANGTNTIDNTNYTQAWNWSTHATGNALSSAANALTTGSILSLTTSNASVNSTNGLLTVGNNGSSTSGAVFKVMSNGNIAGAGLMVRANGTTGIGTTSSTALLHLGGTPDLANGSTNGMFFRADASAVTDNSTATSGTVTHTAVSAFNTPTLYAANTGVTYTNASTLYIGGAPTAGTNVTITNPYALWVNGQVRWDLGSDATGDLYYRNSSGKIQRLGIGGTGTGLTVSGGVPAWTTNAIGDVTGDTSSVDGEIVLFNSVTGKVIKRATGTGVVIATSGVYSTKTNPSGAFVGDTDTQTLTNKRVNPRVSSTTSSGTPTPNSDTDDVYILTALAASATFGSPTGTPVQGQRLMVRIKDNGTARTLAWNAIYRAVGVTLPTTTVINKTLYIGFVYNSTDTKWDAIAVAQEA